MAELLEKSTRATGKIIKKIDDLNNKAWEAHIKYPNHALELSNEAKNLSEKYSYQKGIAYALRNMGVSHRYLSNLETALSLSLMALDMFVQLNETSAEAQALVSIGAIYFYMGNYEKSLDYFLNGLEQGKEIGNKEAQVYGYNGAGYIYGVLGNNKKALEFLHLSLALSEEIKNISIQSSVLDSLAFTYLNDGQMDMAYKYYVESLQTGEHASLYNKGHALLGIGVVFQKQNKFEGANEYLLQSLSTSKEAGDKSIESETLLYLGKLYLEQKDLVKAKDYLQESLTVAESGRAKAIMYQAHETLAGLFEQEQDFKAFAEHYKLFHTYKAEVFKDEQENKQKYQNIQYEMEVLKGEAEINRLKNVVMKEKNEEMEKKTSELEQSYNSISVLSQIGKEITSTLNLDTILNTVYEKVNELMEASVFGIGIFIPEEESIDYRMAIEDGRRYTPYRRKMDNKNQLPVWCIENNKEVFINNVRKEYTNYISEYAEVINATLEDGSRFKSPVSLIYLPLTVEEKVIGLITVQSFSENAYSLHHLDILKTLASYTSAALYNANSFETLQTTLNELQFTQKQLIQSEKMASLGELTAGIAHEIQNPLNFVNNFSEVSKELMAELREALDNGDIEEATAISLEVIQNLEKINHHGKRADSIVKGMLEHSRKSSGKKESTNINALADEYFRLSYHGLRAKDKSFNSELVMHLDNSLPKADVIPQEIGRVLLNLFNNAFYAVNQRAKTAGEDYKPEVTVTTALENGQVVIKVKDNGVGMPEQVKEKIMQPFFTTKPTGEGTGLGLSLTYDMVVKGHGGSIQVNSVEGEGSEFIVTLPIS